MHVVERVETFDWIGRSRFVSRYAYHHGYFDGYEREFRGFGRVEQWDTEEFRERYGVPRRRRAQLGPASWSPPVLTRTWFHTGAFLRGASVSAGNTRSEYWTEPALRPDAGAARRDAAARQRAAGRPDRRSRRRRPTARSKGRALRVEVYADDGSPLAANPYSIAETNYTVSCLPATGPNRHAVSSRTRARR